MSLLDELKEKRVDVESVCDETDEGTMFEYVPKDPADFVKSESGYRVWLSFVKSSEQHQTYNTKLLYFIRNYLFEISTVKNWSKIYRVRNFENIIIGFNPESFLSVRSGIRLILSILNMFRISRFSSGGIIKFMWLNSNGLVYNILYTVDFMDQFDKRSHDISGLKIFLDIICSREISEREFKKAVDKTSLLIYRSRQKRSKKN